MININNSWKELKMENLGEIISGGTPRTDSPDFWDGDINWITPTDVTALKGRKYITRTKRKISSEGLKNSSASMLPVDTLIVCTRATIGDSIINKVPISTNQGFKSLITNPDVSTEYMYYWVLNNKNKLLKQSSGSTFLELSTKSFKSLDVILPPIFEQKKIAQILSVVDDKIEVIDKQIIEIQKLKKGLMQQLLINGIGHKEFKDSSLGKIPKEWEVVPIYELRNKNDRYGFTGGPFGSDLKSEHYTKTGVKIIQLQNIGEGKFIDKGIAYTSINKADELHSCNIFPNEIILAKMAPVARCCKVPSTDDRYVMCSDGIRLSIDTSKYDNEFVFQALNSKYFRDEAESKSTGTTRARIGLKELKLIPILIPKDIEEQKKIANILRTVDEKSEVLHEKKLNYQELKQGLMQQLLTGKIRVKV